eukprot:GSChrysophyteH1.ASY1.ANO1.534.1 assembled CDS
MSASSGVRLLLKGRTAVVTGAGGGLGRAYALDLGRRGANVVVNDVSGDSSESVVQEIINSGGKAIANTDDVVTSPDGIIAQACRAFGSDVDILVNNAGILRDKSFAKAQASDWSQVIDVHLNGTYGLCREAWQAMMKNEYGRIVNVGSGAGLYGNFGQASYSAAKMGIVGLTQTLALEGDKHNIRANVVVPIAESRMTKTVLPEQILSMLEPEHVASLVSYLCHESCNTNGGIFECGGGWYSQVRWQRSAGARLGNPGAKAQAEDIAASIDAIQDFQSGFSYPSAAADALKDMISGGSPKIPIASSAVCECDAIFDKMSGTFDSDPHMISSAVGKRAVQFAIRIPQSNDVKVYVLDCSVPAEPTLQHYASLDDAKLDREGLPFSDVTISVSDSDFMLLCSGDLSAEWAYATGKMTVDGSMGVALKMKKLLELAGKL